MALQLENYDPALKHGAVVNNSDDLALASGKILVGGSDGLSDAVTMSGDATISTAGALTITGSTGAFTATGALTASSTSQFNGTVTVGVNDTGYDVKFFGATSGKYWEWDESANKMNLAGDAGITGIVTLNSGTKIVGSASNTFVPVIVAVGQETIAAGTGGAISVATHMSDISSDAGGDAFTLASGADIGQLKYILMTADGGGNCVITATFSSGDNTLTMADSGDYALLQWNGSAWAAIELGNRVDGISAPVLSTV